VPVFRPITAEDKERLTRFHGRLSTETRYRRYHGAKGDLTRRELQYLTEVDGREHVAIVAELPDGELGGVARVAADGDGTAEVAVVVADDCRGMGIGTGTVRAAVEAYAAVRPQDEVLALVQADNRPALRLFREALGGRSIAMGDGVVTIRVPARGPGEPSDGLAAAA
jgi:acetyltransferase